MSKRQQQRRQVRRRAAGSEHGSGGVGTIERRQRGAAGPCVTHPRGPARNPAPALRARRRGPTRPVRARQLPGAACARPARPEPKCLPPWVRPWHPASPPTSSIAPATTAYIALGGYPSTLALQGLPEVALHVGERDHLPRHPRRPPARQTATSSTATSRSTCTACTATAARRSSSATSTRSAAASGAASRTSRCGTASTR